jgi:hypothetical protein
MLGDILGPVGLDDAAPEQVADVRGECVDRLTIGVQG